MKKKEKMLTFNIEQSYIKLIDPQIVKPIIVNKIVIDLSFPPSREKKIKVIHHDHPSHSQR